ncbi:MAG: sigma-70 family RNA polymerase sigma factor [Deltaproteobacteria bacterium]|nr:sigma-70 family RNA polymerase sigma factor [Deltaproteobacteria bacterium]MBK8714482.1 sigma-70 family RNA polymerase sigma factor [Deltaproteobacteria bacterium]MBP7288242.1 sigma-70 family RNA polymerase sigma factor [Nannocystaceae bacterium]
MIAHVGTVPAIRTSSEADARDTAFVELYRRQSPFVWRCLRAAGVPSHAAEDLLQDVFIRAREKMSQYDGRASLSTWLFHLTRGVVSNWRRGAARYEARLSRIDPPVVLDADPEVRLRQRQAAQFVWRFLDTLDDNSRQIFILVEVEGHTVAEAASAVGVNANTAYARMRAMRAQFARQLEVRTDLEGGSP